MPAFTGLGAPYWDSNARGTICGLTRAADWKDIVRAVIESVVYQSYDLLKAMNNDGLKAKIIKVDGGMVKNNWFLQFLSNILGIKVMRASTQESTALGAAFIAGHHIGVFNSLNSISKNWQNERIFRPKINKTSRSNLLKGWQQAIKRTLV